MLIVHVLLEIVALVSKDSFYTGLESNDIPDLMLLGIQGNYAYLMCDQQMQEKARWRRGGKAREIYIVHLSAIGIQAQYSSHNYSALEGCRSLIPSARAPKRSVATSLILKPS